MLVFQKSRRDPHGFNIDRSRLPRISASILWVPPQSLQQIGLTDTISMLTFTR